MTQPTEQISKSILVNRETKDIFKAGLLNRIAKAVVMKKDDAVAGSNQSAAVGIRTPLIDKELAQEIRDFNTTHAACLDAKASSTVGMGHRDETIHEVLDPLCQFSWQDTLDALCMDYWETGECFLEVVKGEDGDPNIVTGLYHIESKQCQIEVEEEDNSTDYHYVVTGETAVGSTTVMARWGDLEALKKRYSPADGSGNPNTGRTRSSLAGEIANSEIIHIRQPTNRSRYYGYPDYMSATPSIELVQCMTQYEFDFFFNRGVPEFLMFLIGSNVTPATWTQVKDLIQANQGLGNSHKTGAVHIPGSPEAVTVQIEKLAMEDSGNNGFTDKSHTLAMLIATAHGVPPMLANILLPGKIGAANEGPNALLIFQKRKLGQAQRNFSAILARTLGAPETQLSQPDGTKKKLTSDQFRGKTSKPKPNPMDPQGAMGTTDENGMPIFAQPGNGFKTVLDGMTLGAQETLSRMKEPLATSDRDPEDGLLGGADDRKAGDRKKTR